VPPPILFSSNHAGSPSGTPTYYLFSLESAPPVLPLSLLIGRFSLFRLPFPPPEFFFPHFSPLLLDERRDDLKVSNLEVPHETAFEFVFSAPEPYLWHLHFSILFPMPPLFPFIALIFLPILSLISPSPHWSCALSYRLFWYPSLSLFRNRCTPLHATFLCPDR